MDMLICGKVVHCTVSPLEHLLYPSFRFQPSTNGFHISGKMDAQKSENLLKIGPEARKWIQHANLQNHEAEEK